MAVHAVQEKQRVEGHFLMLTSFSSGHNVLGSPIKNGGGDRWQKRPRGPETSPSPHQSGSPLRCSPKRQRLFEDLPERPEENFAANIPQVTQQGNYATKVPQKTPPHVSDIQQLCTLYKLFVTSWPGFLMFRFAEGADKHLESWAPDLLVALATPGTSISFRFQPNQNSVRPQVAAADKQKCDFVLQRLSSWAAADKQKCDFMLQRLSSWAQQGQFVGKLQDVRSVVEFWEYHSRHLISQLLTQSTQNDGHRQLDIFPHAPEAQASSSSVALQTRFKDSSTYVKLNLSFQPSSSLTTSSATAMVD
eukprot:g58433.t1